MDRAVQTVTRFNLNHPGVKAEYTALAVTSLLATIKHPGFSEEREWRLVIGLQPYQQGPKNISFDPVPTQFPAIALRVESKD